MLQNSDEFVVDRIEGNYAVVEILDGTMSIPVWGFSWDVKEGDIFKYDLENLEFVKVSEDRQREIQKEVDDLFASLLKKK